MLNKKGIVKIEKTFIIKGLIHLTKRVLSKVQDYEDKEKFIKKRRLSLQNLKVFDTEVVDIEN